MASTCLKDAFEAFWRRRYGVDGVLTPSTAPHLDCLDPRGQATAQSVEHSLAQCRERMAGLRQRIRDEEYLEEFLSGVLRDGQALLVGSTDGLPKSENGVGEKGMTIVMSQNIESRDENSPFNSRITIAERRQRFEVLAKLQDIDGGMSVKKPPKMAPKKVTGPKTDVTIGKELTDEKSDALAPASAVNANSNLSQSPSKADDVTSEHNKDSVEEKRENELHPKDHSSTVEHSSEEDVAKQPGSDGTALDTVSIASVGSIRRKNHLTSVSSTNADNTNEDDASDDDASNLQALRQSVNFANRWCEGVDSTRSRLEEQAQRLSKRFTHLHYGKGLDGAKSQELTVVVESPASPSPSMGQQDQLGGNDADWVPTPTLFVPVMDLGGGRSDEVLKDAMEVIRLD